MTSTSNMQNISNHDAQEVEPLEALARLAWEAAPRLCHPDHHCQDYHRSWSLVRLLVGQGQLPAGEEFFQREFARLAQRGNLRVLVSGGADSGVSALVLKVSRAAGVEPDLVFVDRCATACELNARLAQAVNARMEVIQSDICDLDIEPVDVVIAHTFLPFFEGDQRQRVLESWHRNTRVGGEVLMSNVLKASEADWATRKSTDALQQKSMELLHAAQQVGYALADAEQMAQTAERFWLRQVARPPGLTESNLRAGLERAGFGDISMQYKEAGVNGGPLSVTRHRQQSQARAEIRAVRGTAPSHPAGGRSPAAE